MFEKCTTLRELNAARVEEAAKGTNIVEVNNAYNARKKELMNSSVNYTRVETIPVNIETESQYLASLVYKGPSTKPGTIEITPQGVYA